MATERSERTDRDLIKAIQAGSQDAFSVIVRRYQRQIANLVFLSLGNRAEVEDLTQEVFVRFYQNLDRLKDRESVFPWLYRIAANLCIDESRKRSIRKALSLDFLVEEGLHQESFEDTAPRPDREAEAWEERTRILAALGRLPAQSRVVVVMRDYEDLTYQEIATVLGLSVPAVKTRLFRARQRLAKILKTR